MARQVPHLEDALDVDALLESRQRVRDAMSPARQWRRPSTSKAGGPNSEAAGGPGGGAKRGGGLESATLNISVQVRGTSCTWEPTNLTCGTAVGERRM